MKYVNKIMKYVFKTHYRQRDGKIFALDPCAHILSL